jgi:L-aminopeptidase/D-esterase-like protein
MNLSSARMNYFVMLSPEEQIAAMKRLALSGVSEYGVASATGLSVEAIRRLLQAEPKTEASA